MPRYLYLMRHAQSADKQGSQSDKERELTTSGMKDALLIGNHLHLQKKIPQIIFTSTAIRAQSTASLILDAIKAMPEMIIPEEELYNASVRTFLQFIQQTDNLYETALFIGHNPTITYLAEYITREPLQDMKPADLVMIQFNGVNWKDIGEGNGILTDHINPDSLVT